VELHRIAALRTTSYPCAIAALARLLPTCPLPIIPIVVMLTNLLASIASRRI
jgi:hypothetical protein